MQYGNRPFPLFTAGDWGWGGQQATPPTEQRTNPGDTQADAPDRDVELLGVSFPWGAAMLFMLIGLFGVGWYFTARVRT